MLQAYAGKQSLETEDSQTKTANISRFSASLHCEQGLVFLCVFCSFECQIPVPFPLSFVMVTLKQYPFYLTILLHCL